MLEKTTRGLKLFAGIVVVLLILQTVALGAVLARLTDIQAQITIWQRLDTMGPQGRS